MPLRFSPEDRPQPFDDEPDWLTGRRARIVGARIEFRRTLPLAGWWIIGNRDLGAIGPFKSEWAAQTFANRRSTRDTPRRRRAA